MLLAIIGIVAIVVCAIQAYKAAASTDRNGPLWTALVVVTGVVFQFVLPVLFAMVLAIYFFTTGTPQNRLESEISGSVTLVSVAGIVVSVIAMGFFITRLAKIREEEPVVAPPPPPPTFDGEQ